MEGGREGRGGRFKEAVLAAAKHMRGREGEREVWGREKTGTEGR